MCLFIWFVVIVYWIKLFVLIEKKLIFFVNWLVRIVVVGILIIILSLMELDIFVLVVFSFVFLFSKILCVWWNLFIVVIIGNIIFKLLYIFVWSKVWSCVWNNFLFVK